MAHRIVLGLGGSVDYEIAWSSEVIEELVAAYGIRADDLDNELPITDERSLVVSVLEHFRRGVGGERHVASPDVLESFSNRFSRKITLGGTGVRAGLALARLGITSTLHLVSINDHFRRLLPSECTWITSAEADSVEPHLIVQWEAGTRIYAGGDILTAPFPNRLIYVNDSPNAEMRLSQGLPQVLADAEILLLSGMNAMQDGDVLTTRLGELTRSMRALPGTALVYYEDAGFHVPSLNASVRSALLERIDVYGMNEDEMQAHLGHPVDLLSPESVIDAVKELAVVVPARTLVVHTKYWALATGARAKEYASALTGGVAMASTRYRYGDEFTPEQYSESAHLPSNSVGAVVAEALSRRSDLIAVPAKSITTAAPTTVGLGDSFVGGFLGAIAREGVPAWT